MSIRTVSGQLRRMGDQEGLILQGCGGDPQEWVDGINEILAKEGILKKGTGFEEAYTFRHDGLTCMLFPFKEDIELDVGKLAAWRLAFYSTFGGTWLSDYVPNQLGGFIQKQISGDFLCTDEKLAVTIPDAFLLIQGDRSIKESVDSSVIQALLPLLTGSGE